MYNNCANSDIRSCSASLISAAIWKQTPNSKKFRRKLLVTSDVTYKGTAACMSPSVEIALYTAATP